MIKAAVCFAFMVIAVAATEPGAADVPEPDGYRLGDYRAPTPATLRGARAIGTDEAETIWRSHSASFVDVLPRAPRPRDLPAGTLWRDKPRANIPGSIWLPDTGYG
jgi:PQQ-dependent catabolism-associated CXXCW motif protein